MEDNTENFDENNDISGNHSPGQRQNPLIEFRGNRVDILLVERLPGVKSRKSQRSWNRKTCMIIAGVLIAVAVSVFIWWLVSKNFSNATDDSINFKMMDKHHEGGIHARFPLEDDVKPK
ncbi:unnamed protein product [Larinioides sclopetarius]|uniref:Uncharacterized protein n=1 Tax=Larinioides sclopetarius TaxID=280406 RepID=A0AAV2B898_9ARAC